MLSCSRPSRIRWHTSVNHHLAHDSSRENFLYELNFLYEFKRRLRAARKRAVLAAEYRGTRVARNPQPAAARPRRAHHAPAFQQHGEEER
jgi:hypothetical protein